MIVKFEVFEITGNRFIDELLSWIIFSIIYVVFIILFVGIIAFISVSIGKLF